MDTMQAGHHKVDAEKYVGVVTLDAGIGVIFPGKLSQFKFMLILKIFDHQENGGKE